MDEVAQRYAKQSIKFIKVDIAQLAYSDMIKMGVTAVPVVRLHSQATQQLLLLFRYAWGSLYQAHIPTCKLP